jgi:hypothetical protein
MPRNETFDLSEIRLCTSPPDDENIIGLAVYVNDRDVFEHAGIYLRYNFVNYIFHYNGKDVVLSELDREVPRLYYKDFVFTSRALIPSVYNYFKKVEANVQPRYGYFYAGSMYDANGNFAAPGEYPEYMTCVGFCLSVFKFLLRGDFIRYRDWGIHDNVPDEAIDNFLQKIVKHYPTINLSAISAEIRRITPLEYFTSGFSPDHPVEKFYTDAHSSPISTEILNRLN